MLPLPEKRSFGVFLLQRKGGTVESTSGLVSSSSFSTASLFQLLFPSSPRFLRQDSWQDCNSSPTACNDANNDLNDKRDRILLCPPPLHNPPPFRHRKNIVAKVNTPCYYEFARYIKAVDTGQIARGLVLCYLLRP